MMAIREGVKKRKEKNILQTVFISLILQVFYNVQKCKDIFLVDPPQANFPETWFLKLFEEGNNLAGMKVSRHR